MSVVGAALVGAGLFALAGAAGAAGSHDPRVRRLVAGVSTCAAGSAGVLAGVALLSGRSFSASVPQLLPFSSVELSADALSGVFVALVGAVAIAAGLYGVGYTSGEDHGAGSRTSQAMLPLFVAAMVWVPFAGNVTTFLVLWELMALTSLVLVLAEHRERPAVRTAGVWYAAMTHAGLVAILLALVVFASKAGGESFDALRAAVLPGWAKSVVFVLAFVGFGSKAGMVPLHVWLPRAHPEAPSHVSALMSAAMVKLGLYGLLRSASTCSVADGRGGGCSSSSRVPFLPCTAYCRRVWPWI